MSPASRERVLDLRGLRCPWPALRVGRAIREGDAAVLAISDDPRAPAEIAAIASAHGWTVAPAATPQGPALRVVRGIITTT